MKNAFYLLYRLLDGDIVIEQLLDIVKLLLDLFIHLLGMLSFESILQLINRGILGLISLENWPDWLCHCWVNDRDQVKVAVMQRLVFLIKLLSRGLHRYFDWNVGVTKRYHFLQWLSYFRVIQEFRILHLDAILHRLHVALITVTVVLLILWALNILSLRWSVSIFSVFDL